MTQEQKRLMIGRWTASVGVAWQEASFDPPLELVSIKSPVTCSKKTPDTVRHDLACLLVKNKNLLAELRNLQNKLLMKESSLKEIKSELESYKENNMHQSIQIMSLKDDIKNLEKLIASLKRIKSLKNTNIEHLERGNWALTERIMELENRLRTHLVEREKAERKADLLEKKLASGNTFIPCLHSEGQEHLLNKDEAILVKNFEKDNIFHLEETKNGQKIGNKCQQDLIHKKKQKCELNRSYSFDRETKTMESHYQTFLGQLASLLSNSKDAIPATEEAVKERIQEIGANEQSLKSRTEGLQQKVHMLTKQLEQLHHHCEETTQESSQSEKQCKEQKLTQHFEGKFVTDDFFQARSDLDRNNENAKIKNSQTDDHKMFKHLEKDKKYCQQEVLNIQQNLDISITQRLEEKVQKLQKQLSDLKLSNKNMKTQLTRVNILKEKTIKKLRQSITKAETVRGKTLTKTDNLRTASNFAKQEARTAKEKTQQVLKVSSPEVCPNKSTPEAISGQKTDFAKQEARTVKEKTQQVLKASSPEICPNKSTSEAISGQKKLANFEETIMKMLGFNVKTSHKDIINHLRLILQVYEASEKSKLVCDCDWKGK